MKKGEIMPGVVEEYVRKQQTQAFEESYRNTREHLERQLFERSTANYWDSQDGKALRWTNEYEREVVKLLAITENQFIKQAQFETPGSIYATNEAYRHGAREGVMQFSREHNHRLLQAEREKEIPTERIRVG
jgi:hypothetical protein